MLKLKLTFRQQFIPSGFAKFFGLVLMLGGASLSLANPFPLYTDTPCGGPGQEVCSITRGGHPGYPAGLTNALFVAFFDTYIPSLRSFPDPRFTATPIATSADGYTVGGVSGPDGINTQFVYHSGTLLCCTIDEPFQFSGISNNDIVIGFNGNGCYDFAAPLLPIAGGHIGNYCGGPNFTDPTFDPYTSAWRFLAIDDQNRILARDGIGGQEYIVAPTPEPASLLLLPTLLVVCAFLGKCSRLKKAN